MPSVFCFVESGRLGIHNVAQISLELAAVLQLLPPEHWNYRWGPRDLTIHLVCVYYVPATSRVKVTEPLVGVNSFLLPGNQTQVTRLGGKHLFPLSRLNSSHTWLLVLLRQWLTLQGMMAWNYM